TYRRLDYGRAYMSDPADIIPNGKLHPNDYTVGLAWGYAIDPRFQVGVGVKMFNQNDLVGWWGSQLSDADLGVKSGPAFVCDLGVLSNTGSLFGNGKVQDNLSLGLALQGFGTPFRYHYTGESFYYDPATGVTRIVAIPIDYTIPLGRNLRIGIAYHLEVMSEVPSQLSPFSIVVMGEYRDLLNATMWHGNASWGLGVEISIFELLQLRGGGEAEPFDGVYGYQNTLHGRYGVGVHLPIQRIAPGWPSVVIEGDYSLMQLVDWTPSMLRMYSLRVRYTPGR
ncbi:MAG TPA: hypothetical protein VMH23_20055, partial [Bacteroidota bacterium]|nr:hypothetical protein [Bacteroidota bacterium]